MTPSAQDYDIQHVTAKIRAVTGDDSADVTAFVFDGAPVSKARARWSRRSRSFYTPEKTSTAEESLAWEFKRHFGSQPFNAGVAIVAVFYRPNRQRIDADNLMKLVMDAATKAQVWRDDCYVYAQASFVEMDADRPRTVIALCPIKSTMDRNRMNNCSVCGKEIPEPRRTCSRKCNGRAHQKELQPARCAHCNKVFRRKKAAQKLCSKDCVMAYANAIRVKKVPAPRCLTCSGKVSRREYVQCANCAPKGRKIGSKNRTWKGVPCATAEQLPLIEQYGAVEQTQITVRAIQ